MIEPSQLSACWAENLGCIEFTPLGITKEKFGSAPFAASGSSWVSFTTLLCWALLKQDAKDGQIAHGDPLPFAT